MYRGFDVVGYGVSQGLIIFSFGYHLNFISRQVAKSQRKKRKGVLIYYFVTLNQKKRSLDNSILGMTNY